MRLQFLGANRQVTGSCTMLENSGVKVLIDCGLFQEHDLEARNREPFAFEPAEISAVVLTHAHLDHCGLLPKLVRDGFKGPIFTTPPTIDLARLVLADSARLQEEDAEDGLPIIYSAEDVEETVRRMRPVPYWQAHEINDNLALRFRDAGHILGSSIVELMAREDGKARLIVFSGDLGQHDAPLVRDPSHVPEGDYVVMETTYGREEHEHDAIEDVLEKLINQISETNGKLLIPTFAIERAQAILYHLSHMAHEGRIPHIPTFLDSPMAVEATRVFQKYPEILDKETRDRLQNGEKVLGFTGLTFAATREQSKMINKVDGAAVILAGSGMCTGGRIVHHLSHHIWQPSTVILFTGYQATHTLGRAILDGKSPVVIRREPHEVRAQVRFLRGLSAHGDRSDLLHWVEKFHTKPRAVFLNHGEEEEAESMRSELTRRGYDAMAPQFGQVVELV